MRDFGCCVSASRFFDLHRFTVCSETHEVRTGMLVTDLDDDARMVGRTKIKNVHRFSPSSLLLCCSKYSFFEICAKDSLMMQKEERVHMLESFLC